MKKGARTHDLTVGNTWSLLLLFALPTLLSNLFQQFYNIADTAIAGHILGDNALVAIGASSSINSLVFTFVFGLNGGFGIVFAQCFGAKRFDEMNKAIAKSVAINLIMATIICVFSLAFIKPILAMMNTPAALIDDAYSYIIIVLCGSFISMMYNLESTILRSLGDSRTPLYFLILSSVINIVLDIALVKYLHFGVRGTALATVASQFIATVLCFVVIKKDYKIIKLKRDYLLGDKAIFKRLLSAGLTMALMNSIFSIGSLIMQRAINSLGEVVIASHYASRRIAEIFMSPLITLGMACSTFVGQNFGAKKYERIRKGLRVSMVYALAFSVVAFVVLFFAGGHLARLVTGTDNALVVENAQMYLRINAPFYFVLGTLFVLRFSIQSVNRKTPPLISSSMELGTKLLAAFVMIPLWGYVGACVAEPISWCLGAAYLLLVFNKTLKSIGE